MGVFWCGNVSCVSVGDAHNEAMRVRSALRSSDLRRGWLISMIGSASYQTRLAFQVGSTVR